MRGAGEIRALRNGRDGARPSRASANQDGTAGGWEGPAPSGPRDNGVCTMRLAGRKALAGPGGFERGGRDTRFARRPRRSAALPGWREAGGLGGGLGGGALGGQYESQGMGKSSPW